MKTIAIDTNPLIDYFLKRPKYQETSILLEQASDGSIILFLPLPVILELEWVLRSAYQRSKNEIAGWLSTLVALPGVVIDGKQLILEGLELYRKTSGVSFDDCVIILIARQAKVDDFVTSDRKLLKLYRTL